MRHPKSVNFGLFLQIGLAIPEKIQTGRIEDMEFPGVTKKNTVEFPGVFVFGLGIAKGSNIIYGISSS